MGIYQKYILPRLIHFSCSQGPTMRQREKVVPLASGRVLEVGIGSGLNLPFYDRSKVTRLWGLEPAAEMREMTRRAASDIDLDVELIDLPGEEIPLESDEVDTVVVTYTLCTIPDTRQALNQVARVLRPGGTLIFCEHGTAPDAGVRRWQNRMNPVWNRIGGGCHLNRDIPGLIEQGGFRIVSMDSMDLPGWRPATFNYWGVATHR